jgi:hypothetical protein
MQMLPRCVVLPEIIVLAAVVSLVACRHSDGRASVVLVSEPYVINKAYESMTGPSSSQRPVRLVEQGTQPQLFWITGVRAEVLDAELNGPASREFFCHSNLMFTDSRRLHHDEFTSSRDGKLVTLIPGRMDLQFPSGFGVPLYSDEPLDNFTMALNLNESSRSRTIRFRTTIDIESDQPAGSVKRLRPLFRRAVYGHEQAVTHAEEHGAHERHSAGEPLGAATYWPVPGSQDQSRTIHWFIGPGHSESRIDVTSQIRLEQETTVHLATAHLHPHAQSVALFDASTNKVIVTIRSRDYATRRGVDEMETWISEPGVPIYPDHQYELITQYDNRTGSPIDAMSILYMYCLDRKFASTHGSKN